MSFWRQVVAIAGRDLRIEGRSRETIGIVVPFAAAAVFVVPFATDALSTRLATIAAPVFWLVGLLFGLQVAMRQSGTETITQRRRLALLGIDPAARFLGRALAASALVGAILVVTVPMVLVFYDPDPVPAPWVMVGTLILFAVGLSLLSTLAGDVTQGLAGRTALAPFLVVPVSVPLLMGAAQTLESLTRGRTTLTWTLLLVVTDLVLAAVGVGTARALEEANT